MPRTPTVNRTIPITHVTVLCMDTVAEEPVTEEVRLPGLYRGKDEKLFRDVSKVIDTDEIKAVHITGKRESMCKFQMTLQEFVTQAPIVETLPIGRE